MKSATWKQNKGVKARAARDLELEAVSRPTIESARAALERKAKIYDKLSKGKTGGLSEAQFDLLLVDFDAKPIEDKYEGHSDDVDESLTVPRVVEGQDDIVEYEDEFGRVRTGRRSEMPPAAEDGNDADDPVIEYEDEFGRMRSARRSEVPRHLLPGSHQETIPDDDPTVIYNPLHHFPVYEPDTARVSAIEKDLAESQGPLNAHYDASREVRARGAGFYQFSGDAEERARQMEALKDAREETARTRADAGAMDVRPGTIEGMRAGEGVVNGSEADSAAGMKGKAAEKRKRELEERRRILDAKRKKVKGVEPVDPASSTRDGGSEDSVTPTTPKKATTRQEPMDTQDPFAAVERQAEVAPSNLSISKSNASLDPFAALEQQQVKSVTSADDFLAQLERDMMHQNRVR